MMLTGTASTGMTVARQLSRKRKTTRVTRIIASTRVLTTSSIEAVMNGVVSNGTSKRTPGGKALASSSMRLTHLRPGPRAGWRRAGRRPARSPSAAR